MMKIAIINPWFISEESVGGTERFVQDLSLSLSRLGYSVDVYMLSGKSYRKDNVNYISIDLFGSGIIADEYMITKKFGKLNNIETYKKISFELEKKINCDNYDFIQLNSHIFLKCWEKHKRIFTLHSNYEEFIILNSDDEFNTMISIMKKERNNYPTYFVTPSSYYCKYWTNLLSKNVVFIPHALDIDRLRCNKSTDQLIKKYQLDKNKIKILLPSRLEIIQKRPQLILESLSYLDKIERDKYQVIFTGIDIQYKNNIEILKNIAKKYGINVKFVKFDHINEGYKVTDLVLIPSKSESFGYSALESLYLGIPTILSYIPTLHEIAIETTNYFFFENNKDLAVLLRNNVENFKNERKKVSKEWLKKYDLDLFARRYIEVVNDGR